MAEKTLAQKLGLKAGQRAAILNAPDAYIDNLTPLPEGVTVSHAIDGAYDFVQLFVRNKADIDSSAPNAMAAVSEGGTLWFAYPKKSGAIKTDITRDIGWETVMNSEWGPVASVSIDETWTGLRFKLEKDVKRYADSQFKKK